MLLTGPAEIVCRGEAFWGIRRGGFERGARDGQAAALRAGARLAVVSPASAAKAELVRAGVEALRGMGYETVLMPHALERGPLYYAGTVEQRVADLHAAFADPAIDGIMCTRGGGGRRSCCRCWMRSWCGRTRRCLWGIATTLRYIFGWRARRGW